MNGIRSQSKSERDQKIAELNAVFAAAAGPYNRFPHVSHILGSDWACSVLPNGPNNAAHYREAAFRFLDVRWPHQDEAHEHVRVSGAGAHGDFCIECGEAL